MYKKVSKMLDSKDITTQLLAIRAWNSMREMDKIEARALVQVYGDSLVSMTTKHVADVQAEMLRVEKQDTALSLPAMFAEAFTKHQQMLLPGEHPTDLPQQDIIDAEPVDP